MLAEDLLAVCHLQILDQYNFGSMKLHDVAVTPDGLRLIGVGPLLASPNGLQPSKSRAEKRLVGECSGSILTYSGLRT